VVDGDPGAASEFLLDTLSDPLTAALFAIGGLASVAAVVGYLLVRPRVRDLEVLRATLAEYDDLVPWMLRLSAGLPLVGAGFAGYFFAPVVDTPVRVFQVGIGFLLLFGLATRAVAVVGLGAYAYGLTVDPRLLLASEYVPLFVAITLLGGGRPSADDLLTSVARAPGTTYGGIDPVGPVGDRIRATLAPYRQYVPTVLRIGLGANFVYLGLFEKLLAPGRAALVVARYDLTAVAPVSDGAWVVGAGVVEVALGLVLIAGLVTRAGAAVAFLVFTATLFGLPDDPVLAHVTLFGIASAVFTLGSGPLALDQYLAARAGESPDPETAAVDD
jgi:uncharacterized membrane protein YphA (DoxX/SURF4 family)